MDLGHMQRSVYIYLIVYIEMNLLSSPFPAKQRSQFKWMESNTRQLSDIIKTNQIKSNRIVSNGSEIKQLLILISNFI